MTDPPQFDPLAARCPQPWCRMPPVMRCVTAGGRSTSKAHAPRVRLSLAITAHADPELHRLWPRIGPCGICGVPGLDQQHRVIDSIAGWLEAAAADPRGTDPQMAEVLAEDPSALDGELAAEFGVSEEAVAAVRAWAQKWPGAW